MCGHSGHSGHSTPRALSHSGRKACPHAPILVGTVGTLAMRLTETPMGRKARCIQAWRGSWQGVPTCRAGCAHMSASSPVGDGWRWVEQRPSSSAHRAAPWRIVTARRAPPGEAVACWRIVSPTGGARRHRAPDRGQRWSSPDALADRGPDRLAVARCPTGGAAPAVAPDRGACARHRGLLSPDALKTPTHRRSSIALDARHPSPIAPCPLDALRRR